MVLFHGFGRVRVSCDGGNANRLGHAGGRRGKDLLVLLTRTEDLGNGLPGDQVRDVEELTVFGESAAQPTALEKLSHGGGAARSRVTAWGSGCSYAGFEQAVPQSAAGLQG